MYIYCFLSVSIFVYRNLKYNTINIDQYNIDYIIEACAIEFDPAYNKLYILADYKSPRGNFTNFLNRLDLILQKYYNSKYNITCGDGNVNYLKIIIERANFMLYYFLIILLI